MIDQRPAAARACLAPVPDLRRQRLLLLFGGAAAGAVLLLGAPAHAQDAGHAQGAAAPLVQPPPPAERSVHDIDPWQKMNRGFFKFHNFLDRLFIRPAAMVYRALTPGPIGKAAHNFLVNIEEPAILANDLLQLRFKRAGETSIRLVGNTLAGFGGLIDVAGKAGIPFHDNGFAITMGRYGIGPGPYLFVPLMGPSSVRDAIGTAVDFTLDPIKLVNYPHRAEVSVGLTGLQGLDLRSRNDVDFEALFADATDPYATLRSTYLQNQQAQVDGRDNPGDVLPELETIPSEPAPPTDANPPGPAESPPTTPPGAVSGLDLQSLPYRPVIIDAGLNGAQPGSAAAELVSAPAAQPLAMAPFVVAQAETSAWR